MITAEPARKNPRALIFIIVGFMAYQLALCFVNTNLFMISNAAVASTEAALLCFLAFQILPGCRLKEMAVLLSILFYFFILWGLRGEVDPAGPRNVLVIFFAYALGRMNPDRHQANRIVWIVSGIVLFVGVIEYFFTNTYLHVFNILQYYIARGEVSESVKEWVKQDTFVSGFRPGGRNLLPVLGDLRVSSVFLEPVSMGNYAIIVAMWALSFGKAEKKQAIAHFMVASLLIIACDSRFAFVLIFFLLGIRFLPFLQKNFILVLMPFLAVGGLIGFTHLGLGNADDDNMSGRLLRTGEALLDMDFTKLIGISSPDPLPDMGIPYALEHFGLFLSLFLWLRFAVFAVRDQRAARFKLMMAIYCLGILAISGTSFFSTKTAILAWFLFGVLSMQKTSEAVSRDARYALASDPDKALAAAGSK